MIREPFDLAIVTGEYAPQLSDGGQRLAAALAERGIDSDPVLWDDPSVDWSAYDGVLVRSCWDYPDDIPRFRAMLDELDRADVPVCNPLRVIRWDLHKSYLTTLADAGVRIPPTASVDRGSDVTLEAILRDRGWDEAVVKPAVGAMSSRVWRTSASEAAASADRFADLLADQDVLVQRFVPEIETGERSIVLFGGEYSHAWNSLPADGDVTEFDGIDADYSPPDRIRAQALTAFRAACDALDVAPAEIPYARVDYVHREGDLLLMELELIEPYLGFERGENSVERFRDALVAFFEDRRGE